MTYLDDPAKWPRLAQCLRIASEFAIDTETYGQPDRTSPQHRARVHCWSVGLLGRELHPRGYRRATGLVLPRAALDHPAIRAVLADQRVRKYAHNAPHDHHALLNEGLEVAGLEDTLQWLRVVCPGRAEGYGLKEAEQWALGYGSRPGFLEMVGYQREVVHVRRRAERGCVCGASPCRARSTSDWLDESVPEWRPHTRVTWRVFTPVRKLEAARYEVTDFVPGHPRWIEWLNYSLWDATRGMELVDWIRNRKAATVAYPWCAKRIS